METGGYTDHNLFSMRHNLNINDKKSDKINNIHIICV